MYIRRFLIDPMALSVEIFHRGQHLMPRPDRSGIVRVNVFEPGSRHMPRLSIKTYNSNVDTYETGSICTCFIKTWS